jgi:hypothetical protein
MMAATAEKIMWKTAGIRLPPAAEVPDIFPMVPTASQA